MMTRLKSLSAILISAYVVLCAYAAIFMMRIPERLLEALELRDVSKVEQVEQALKGEYQLLIFCLFFSLVIIFVLSYLAFRGDVSRVVYVEKVVSKKDGGDSANEEAQIFQQNGLMLIQEFDAQIEELKTSDRFKAEKVLSSACNLVEAVAGAIYYIGKENEHSFAEWLYGYAWHLPESQRLRFDTGEGLVGQVAASGKEMHVEEIPEGYVIAYSGLGKTAKAYLSVFPISHNGKMVGILEIAAFHPLHEGRLALLRHAAALLATLLAQRTTHN